MAIATPLYSLPNEILLQILTPLTSRTLLSLAAVSLRFHDIVLRILHYRLLLASSLEDYKLILECFHPVAKLIHPHLFCRYLGTPGLTENHEGKGSLYEGCGTSECLARLSGLYSCFRPEVDDARQTNDDDDDDDDDDDWNGKGQRESPLLPKKQISLDEYEDFSQLCAVVNLVKVVPSSMRLVSAVTVEDGVLRIWRDWLKRQSKKENMNNNYYEDTRRNNEKDNDDSSILWLDLKKTVGLKLRVKEKKWRQQEMPVLMHGDEEPAVSYEVEIEEIGIRTTHLLLTVEQSLAEQNVNSNAIIIGYGHIFENVVYTLVH